MDTGNFIMKPKVERTLFYLCKMFADQLHKGDSYNVLKISKAEKL